MQAAPHRAIGALFVTLAATLVGGPAVARAASPSEATVFIRILGTLRAEYGDVRREVVEERDVEVATGSGFVVSPYGYVVTNHHVVSDTSYTRAIGGRPVEFTRSVSRIEVIFPVGAGGLPSTGTGSAPRFTATVYASDPELDLAVLFISGADFPYLPLADSDAIAPGEAVQVVGFPFGRLLEVGLPTAPERVPSATIGRGQVAALREGADGATSFIQTNAAINPGNSGGPMVDADGFAVGVVSMRLDGGRNIGFTIPINRVKSFLATHGLDQLLPVRPLRLGAVSVLDAKGLSLALPLGFEDAAPSRLRVDAAADGVALRIDRLTSPWRPSEVEEALLLARTFEPFSAAASRRWHESTARTAGSATGTPAAQDGIVAMEYAIVGLPNERLLARYIGPIEAIAFNRSILRASLESLDPRPWLSAPRAATPPEWQLVRFADTRAPRVPGPAGWIPEPLGPVPCAAMPAPAHTLGAWQPERFSTSFRLAWWDRAPRDADAAAAACGPPPQDSEAGGGAASYETSLSWLGVTYVVAGRFIRDGQGGLVQAEVVSPADTAPFVATVLEAWTRQAAR